VSSIESVLLQVRVAISSLEPRPARLAHGGSTDYGVGEAVEAYIRACTTHGWTVPAGFQEMAYGGSASNQ
jgi:ubiquitin-conjugating enzyme E2 Q